MAKKKNDPYEEAKEQGTKLEDFVIYQRVDAFAASYNPATEVKFDESFNETRLRNFFKAWPTSLGDPLELYLERLKDKGFNLAVSVTGDLCIFTTENTVASWLLNTIKNNAALGSDKIDKEE